MKILYIFPHPDDESFGPAGAMDRQLKQGHEVYLLTLTRGGATKQRFRLGLSVEEMGSVRYQEMLDVEETLGLSGMTVLDLPDSGLKFMDPRDIEEVVREHIEIIMPAVIVTYPVHGVSGFHDHLVTHAIVKRLFLEMRDQGATYLKRLAFFTMKDNGDPQFKKGNMFRIKQSTAEEISCIIKLQEENIQALKNALRCYQTYQETIQNTGVVEAVGDTVYFEIFGESHHPPINDLTIGL